MNNQIELYPHQKGAIALGSQENLAIIHDCGIGKTLTAIEIISCLRERISNRIKVLIVCPLSVIEDAWVAHLESFAPFHLFNWVNLWDKSPKKRYEKLAEDHDVYLINYEQFKSMFDAIKLKKFDVLVVDEASKMKNNRSGITRALLAMAGIESRGGKKKKTFAADCPVPYRYVLSGTLAPNVEYEYWAPIVFITGPGNKIFNDNFYAFRNKYFYPISLGGNLRKWVFDKDYTDEFYGKITQVSHIAHKSEITGFPEQVNIIRRIYLNQNNNERKAYDKFEKTLVLKYKDATILATTALVEIMKLRQLASGFFYIEKAKKPPRKKPELVAVSTLNSISGESSKLIELESLLNEIGDNQVIIWAQFKHEIAVICQLLQNKKYSVMEGTQQEKELAISDFKGGITKYFIANPQSAGHGIDFPQCSYAIFYSLNYSYESYKQSMDRNHRLGQHIEKCIYYYLIADKTIDEVIFKTITCSKTELANRLLKYFKKVKL